MAVRLKVLNSTKKEDMMASLHKEMSWSFSQFLNTMKSCFKTRSKTKSLVNHSFKHIGISLDLFGGSYLLLITIMSVLGVKNKTTT